MFGILFVKFPGFTVNKVLVLSYECGYLEWVLPNLKEQSS